MNINHLDFLVGKMCWGFLAGPPTGSIIHLHLGEKLKRERIIPNDKLKFGLDQYIGEYHVTIYCDWRLQKGNVPITGSCEPNNPDGPLVSGLHSIIGRKITSARFIDVCGDIQLQFGDIILNVFCNYTGNEDDEYCFQDESNWTLRSKGKNFIDVQKGCKIVIVQR